MTTPFFICLAVAILAVLICICFIIKRMRQMMKNRIRQEEEQTRRLKHEITSNITHELRTPVTGIRGCLETILNYELPPEKERHFVQSAYRQTLALSHLIQDIGLITQLEEAPQSFRLEAVRLSDVLEELGQNLELSLKEKNVRIAWTIKPHIIVQGNRNLLYSVFRNLTDNAMRYAGANVDIHIRLLGEDEQFYHFSYYDNGPGVPDEHLPRLFERFYRIDDGRTRDTGGSGLGLSIVKNAILFHKGSIRVQNRAEGGLEFLFRLLKV
jgi:signal transduction histidine kinase